MQEVQAYWKRFGESATRYADNISQDLFLRTEFIIIGVLCFLCLSNIAIVAISSHYLHFEIATAVISSVADTIASGNLNPIATNEEMMNRLIDVRNSYLLLVGGASLIVMVLFGYVVTRIALAPTRNALIAQKQFIANIAHELRTPLSIIKAHNEIMLLEGKGDANVLEMARSNVEELNRISSIINNLLTLNMMRHPEHMQFTDVDMGKCVRDVLKKLDRLAQSRHVALREEIGEDLYAWGNKSALEQIVVNIVKNAISYTPSNGRVTVKASINDNAFVDIEITDTGIGIPRDKLGRIFEPFYQIDPSRARNIRGSSGLGLAIVSELIKLHRGKISVRSTPAVGTTVRIELPVEAHEAPPFQSSRYQTIEEDNAIERDYSIRV